MGMTPGGPVLSRPETRAQVSYSHSYLSASMPQTLKSCYTRKMKMGRAYRRKADSSQNLFKGTVHIVHVNYGGVQMSDADFSAAYQYAALSANAIRAYCIQYGACSINVDNRAYPFN